MPVRLYKPTSKGRRGASVSDYSDVTTNVPQKKLTVDICSNCHPFFTGQQRIVDTAGRVERFAKRLEKSQAVKATAKPKKQKKTKKQMTNQIAASSGSDDMKKNENNRGTGGRHSTVWFGRIPALV